MALDDGEVNACGVQGSASGTCPIKCLHRLAEVVDRTLADAFPDLLLRPSRCVRMPAECGVGVSSESAKPSTPDREGRPA